MPSEEVTPSSILFTKSTRRLILMSSAGVLAAFLGASAWLMQRQADDVYLDIAASELQRRIALQLPARSCLWGMACVVVSNAQVQLSEGSKQINVVADAKVSLGKQENRVRVAFLGDVRYERPQGAFYLDNIRVDEPALDLISKDVAEVIRRRAPVALRDALRGKAIYVMGTTPAEQAVAKRIMREASVVDGKLHVAFIRFTESP